MTKLSPMMERYMEVKRENPGTMLLFRMGDFYELFYEDAQNAAKVLGLTLTSRDKTSENPTPMAGFPYHQLDAYLQKLIHAGFRAAICDQVEDPKKAKGLVRREVTRVVTPSSPIKSWDTKLTLNNGMITLFCQFIIFQITRRSIRTPTFDHHH